MNPASRFISALFHGYPADESLRLEIRCLPPAYDPHRVGAFPRNWYCLAPAYIDNAATACIHWSRDWDVYVGVLPRQGRTGGQDNVVFANWLFCDVDGVDEGVEGAIARVKGASIDLPDIAVQSGGGLHCYWRLEAPAVLADRDARESFKRTLRRLCLAIGGTSPNAHGDPAAAEVARILRVPGTFNHKRGADNLRPVKMLRCSTDLFVGWKTLYESSPTNKSIARSYDWWRSHLPVEPAQKGPTAKPSLPAYTPSGFISPGLQSWARRGHPEGNRHFDLTSDAAWLVRDVKLSKQDAAALLMIKAQHSPGRRPITGEEIEAMVKWA